MVFRFAISFVLVVIGYTHAKILFHSDFECGETQTAHKLKPGAKTIELIPNFCLEEWDENGGDGMVEGNLPETAEVFRYDRREGSELKGVTGIRKNHVRGVPIHAGNLREWLADGRCSQIRGRKSLKIRRQNPIFGNHSLHVLPSDSITTIARLLVPAKQLHCRLYIRFDSSVFQTQGVFLPLFFFVNDSISTQHLLLQQTDRNQPARFTLENERRFRIEEEVEGPKWISILPGRTYHVEYCCRVLRQNRCEIRVTVNDTLQLMRRVHHVERNKNPKHAFIFGRVSARVTLGGFTIDEFVIADTTIGAIPPQPILSLKGQQLRMDRPGPAAGKPWQAAQWQLSEQNSWMLPIHNSGVTIRRIRHLQFPYFHILSDTINDVSRTSSPVHVPTGIAPGKTYLARARLGNLNGSWGPWSVPIEVSAPQYPESTKETPGLPRISKITIAEIGRKRPQRTIQRGKWYDIYLHVSDPQGWDNLGYTDICLSSISEGAQGNYRNRGGVFRAARNYPFSFSLDVSCAYARETEGAVTSVGMRRRKGLYLDDSQGQYFQNADEGWARARMRLLDSALTGPWVITAYACNRQTKFSRMYRALFHVVSDERIVAPLQETSLAGRGKILAGFLATIALLGGGIVVNMLRRKSRPLIQEDASTKQPALSPRIKEAVEFVSQNYGQEISAKDVARHLNITPGYLSKMFPKETGETIAHYINKVRVDKAKEMLSQKEHNITEIAHLVGFQNEFYFSRVFRKFEGTSPREFRSRNQS